MRWTDCADVVLFAVRVVKSLSNRWLNWLRMLAAALPEQVARVKGCIAVGHFVSSARTQRRHDGAGLQTGDASLNIDAPVVVSRCAF